MENISADPKEGELPPTGTERAAVVTHDGKHGRLILEVYEPLFQVHSTLRSSAMSIKVRDTVSENLDPRERRGGNCVDSCCVAARIWTYKAQLVHAATRISPFIGGRRILR